MIERLLIALALLAMGWAVYQAVRRRQLAQIVSSDPILVGLDLQVPTIVYFTTPTCLPCKTRQQPALRILSTELGDQLQIVQIDATQQPDVADRWGVMTAPTTFVLDKQGKASAVNHGVADVPLLKKQLQLL
jgi:thioredoxin-like negative regulator of GroEL